MDGHHKGKLAVCSQSIYSETEFMKEWVEHQFSIGADEIILHAPQVRHALPDSNQLTKTAASSMYAIKANNTL